MFGKLGYSLKKNSPTLLTIAGAVGLGIAMYKAVKKTLVHHETVELIVDHFNDADDHDKIVCVKTMAKIYAEPAIWTAASLACLACSTQIAVKHQASVIGAYGLLREAYEKRRLPEENVHYIPVERPVGDEDEQLMYDEYSTQYFHSSLADLLNGESRVNEILHKQGYISVGDVQSILKIPQCGCGDSVGWSIDAGDAFYNYNWIDFHNDFVKMDDGLECWIVSIETMPTADYMD